jgi:hypothetical protein
VLVVDEVVGDDPSGSVVVVVVVVVVVRRPGVEVVVVDNGTVGPGDVRAPFQSDPMTTLTSASIK